MNDISYMDILKKFKSGSYSESIVLWATELKKNALNESVRKSLTQAKDHLESSEKDDSVKTNYLNKISSLQSFFNITLSGKHRDSSEENKTASPVSGIKVSASGDIIISDDFNHQVQVYDSEQNLKFAFGKKGNDPGKFHYPKGIDTDSEGNIYVADSWNHRIQKFSVDGKHISSFGSYGNGPGQFNEPSAIAINKNKNILVVDRCNHRIQWFDEKGNSLGSIGHRGRTIEEDLAELHETPHDLFSIPSLEFPSDIAIDSKNDIFIVDSHNHRVLKFDSNGKFVLSFGSQGKEEGELLYPQSIAVDGDDNIFISDLNNHRIQLFSPVGEHYFSFSQNNSKDNMDSPTILACEKEGPLFVGSAFNPKVLTFSYHPISQEERINLKEAIGVNSAESLYFSGNLLCRGGNCDKAAEKYEEALSSITGNNRAILPELPLNYIKAAGESLKEDISSKLMNYYTEELNKQGESILDAYKKRKDITGKLIDPTLKEEMTIIEEKLVTGDIDRSLYELKNEERSLFRKTRENFLELKRYQGFQDEMFRQMLPKILLKQNEDVIKRLTQKALSDFYHHLDMINIFLDDYDSQNSKCFEEIQKGAQGSFSLKDFRLKYELAEVADDFIKLAFPILKSSIHILSQIALQLKTSKNDSLFDLYASLTEEANIRKAGRALFKFRYDFDVVLQLKDSLKVLFSYINLNSDENLSKILTNRSTDKETLLNMDKFNYEKDLIELLFVEEMDIVEKENSLRFGLYSLTDIDIDSFQSLDGAESEEKYTKQINNLKKAIDQLLTEKKQIDLMVLKHETNLKSIHPGDQKSRLQIINEYNLVKTQSAFGNKLILEHLFLYRIISFKRCLYLLLDSEAKIQLKDQERIEEIRNTISTYCDEIINVLNVLKINFRQIKDDILMYENNLKTLVKSSSNIDRAKEIDTSNKLFQLDKDLSLLSLFKNEYASVEITQRSVKKYLLLKGQPEDKSTLVPSSVGLHYDLKFGSSGNKKGQFNGPSFICSNLDGDIFVSDTLNHRIQKFDYNGKHILNIGLYGTFIGHFNRPFGITCDQNNNLFVCDTWNHRIQKFDSNGNFLLSWGEYGDKEGGFNKPLALCLDNEGCLYITDMANHRVQKFTTDGKFVSSFGTEGKYDSKLSRPIAVCCHNGKVLIGERATDKIKIFDRNGNLIESFTYSKETDPLLHGITNIIASPTGHIYISAFWSNDIYILSEEFRLITSINSLIDFKVFFNGPTGVAFFGEYVFICDYFNHRIHRFHC